MMQKSFKLILATGALVLFFHRTSVAFQSSAHNSSPLFSSDEILNLKLAADFELLFSIRRLSESDSKTPEVPALLTYVENGRTVTLNTVLKLRGNSSKKIEECPFPKIKMTFNSNESRGTIFEGQKSLAIGTHCGTGLSNSPLGRLRNGKSPHREDLVYQILEVIGVHSFSSRPVYIEYTNNRLMESLGRHQAFLLESMDSLAARLGGSEIEVRYGTFTSVEQTVGLRAGELETARIYFAEGLIANWDWDLRYLNNRDPMHGRGFWNMAAVGFTDGTRITIPYDFDLSGTVNGKYYSLPKVDRIPEYFSKQARLQVAHELHSKRSELLGLIDSRLADDSDGKKQIADYVRTYLDVTVTKYSE